MSIKKLTKRIWYGSETTVDSEGKTVAAAPPIATNDGSEDWDLNGLVRGELYLNDNKDDPTLFCLGSDNLPKRIGGGATSGGGGIVNVDVDVKEGKGIDVKKDLVGETVIFTVSHEDTSLAVSTSNFDDFFVQNIGVDDFGHVTSVESARLATYLDERYLRKDIDDTAHGNILFDKKIGSSIFIDDWEGKGWEITAPGAATFDSLRVRSDLFVGGRIGSPSFISGFPEGTGWDLSPYIITNSSGVKETRYRLEIDDIVARGSARFYEMIISQLRGENDNVMFSGQMKVAYYDPATGRLYLDTELGVLYNPFRPGDLLEVQRYNGIPSSDNDYYITKQYELQVEEIGIGSLDDGEDRLDWITFKNFVGNLSQIAEGDVLTRVDSATDSTRKGVVKITTIDELGTPHISALYGLKTNPDNSLLARLGNCAGVRAKNGTQLTEQVGLYARGAFFENSTIILQNGDTIEQTFSAMNGKFESLIDGIRNDISAEGGNILVNSSFSKNTDYWIVANNVHFINVDGEYLWLDGSFYVEKDQVSDIYNDNGQNVLRIRNTYILQQNSVMNVPEHEEGEEKTYSFSLFYRVLRPGSCGFGIPGTDLYHEEQLSESDSYQKLSKVGKWDGKGDFELRFTGEILIYGVGLFSDEIADAIVKLQTQILQTEEEIKLRATKDYVDAETDKIYTKYDTSLSLKADKAELTSFKEEYDEFQRVVRRDYATQSWTSNKIQTEVGSYVDGALVGYATTSWTSNQISSSVRGLASETYVNQTANGLNININSLGNRVDNVEGELDSVADITGAFYSFGANKMRLNRRIEMGTGSNTSFQCVSGISPDTSGAAFWAGSTYENQLNAKIKLNHDGSGWLAGGRILWNVNGSSYFTGMLQSSDNGNRFIIDPTSRSFKMINNSNSLVSEFKFDNISGYQSIPTLNMYLRDVNSGSTIYRYSVGISGFSVHDVNGKIISSLSTGLTLTKIPTIDPKSSGMVWRDGTTLKISLG